MRQSPQAVTNGAPESRGVCPAKRRLRRGPLFSREKARVAAQGGLGRKCSWYPLPLSFDLEPIAYRNSTPLNLPEFRHFLMYLK